MELLAPEALQRPHHGTGGHVRDRMICANRLDRLIMIDVARQDAGAIATVMRQPSPLSMAMSSSSVICLGDFSHRRRAATRLIFCENKSCVDGLVTRLMAGSAMGGRLIRKRGYPGDPKSVA